MNERDDVVPGPKDEAVAKLLDRAEMVDPPADLRDNVVRTIEARRPAKRRWAWLELFSAGFRRPTLGMVYPFAVGAIAGIVGFAVLSGKMDLGAPGGSGGMSGAMVPTAPHAKASPVDAQRFELNGANIRLETVRQGGQVEATVSVEGRRDADVTLRFDANRLAPISFRQDGPWDGTMECRAGVIRIVQSGQRRYGIVFQESGAGDAPIRVTMVVQGTTAEGVIHTAPAGASS
ncbi:MAG: hypothetical protein ACM3JJ_07285 [Hyphomicrobiales bacterium]